MHNLFFAVMPDRATAEQIDAFSRVFRREHGLSGSVVDRERLHVTLAFLGGFDAVPETLVGRLSSEAAKLRHKPYTACLDRIATFGRPGRGRRPLILLTDDDENGFFGLHDRLTRISEEANILLREKAYAPHLTLARIDQAVTLAPTDRFSWRVTDFVLMCSRVGQSRYLELGRWPLEGAEGGA